MSVSLPEGKLEKAKLRIRNLIMASQASSKMVQQVIGTLNYLAQIMPAGRTFMFRLRHCLADKRRRWRKPLPQGAKEDLAVWLRFLYKWNSTYQIIREETVHYTDIGVYTDASDWGMGGWYSDQQEWFQHPWTPQQKLSHIGVKELWATKHALERWGHAWAGKTVVLHTDNRSNVDAISARRSRIDEAVAEILREIFFLELTFRCWIVLQHIAGVKNEIADALSRNQMQRFWKLWPWPQ
jgi:hypothetical protein